VFVDPLATCSVADGVANRMYTSTFSDWFSQAVIDYFLGNRTLSVFSEFLLRLQSSDPRDLIRLSRIRAEAIATSVSRVLTEQERLLCGWTVFSPSELNLKFSDKFEEKVLLLVRFSLLDPTDGTESFSRPVRRYTLLYVPAFSCTTYGFLPQAELRLYPRESQAIYPHPVEGYHQGYKRWLSSYPRQRVLNVL